jgi:SAM-dependent methyltransferase
MSLLRQAHKSLVYERRIRRLAELLAEALPDPCSLLDIGCGDGKLASLLSHIRPVLRIEGVDVVPREETSFPVRLYDGVSLPFADSSFDAVMLIDVLHHTRDPLQLLQEALRVSRGSLIVKDHIRQGFAAEARLRFMDYIGNSGLGVGLPYNYLLQHEWDDIERSLGLSVLAKKSELKLYPQPFDYIFGSGLHFFALYQKIRSDDDRHGRVEAGGESGSSRGGV